MSLLFLFAPSAVSVGAPCAEPAELQEVGTSTSVCRRWQRLPGKSGLSLARSPPTEVMQQCPN